MSTERSRIVVEIIGPSGEVHYRRPPGDPLIEEARGRPGYAIKEIVEHV